MNDDLEMQRYLFDLAGFLVIPDVLDQAEIDAIEPAHRRAAVAAATRGDPLRPGARQGAAVRGIPGVGHAVP